MAQIDILMATYNGAQYITAQIRSLQNQTFTDWKLIVHDDGSTDQTLDIVRSFAAQDNRIKLIEDGMQFHGSAGNFMHLLSHSTAPFCMCCDQDDIWLENKLQLMLDEIQRYDNSIPQAVYSNSYVYNANREEISGYATLCFPYVLKDVLFQNSGVQGCAILINAKLRDICKNAPQIVAMHDHVITLAATVFGQLHYLPMRLMLYRRHEATVTGHTAKSLGERVRHFFEGKKTVLDAKHYESIKSFVSKYDPIIPAEKKAIFEDFFRFEKERRWKRCIHIFCGGYRIYGKRRILCIKTLLRPLL